MNTRKKNKTENGLPANPRPHMTAASQLNTEFETFARARFPDEFSDPADCAVLRATWMASARQTAAVIIQGTLAPIQKAAEAEAERLCAETTALA